MADEQRRITKNMLDAIDAFAEHVGLDPETAICGLIMDSVVNPPKEGFADRAMTVHRILLGGDRVVYKCVEVEL